MKYIVFKALLLTVSVCICLVFVEVFLRFIPNPYQPISSTFTYSQFNVLYGIEPKPNLDYSEYGLTVHTNSDATFGPEIQRDETPIILHLGDSYTAGPGIPYEKNYPFLLQELINATSSTTFQSVILGMGGSSPTQQDLIFDRKLAELKPSLVIYEMYDNDAQDDYIFSLSQYKAKIQIHDQFPQWLLQTSIGKRLYVLLSDRLAKQYEKQYELEKDAKSKDYKSIWDNLTQPALSSIKSRAEERGAKFMLFYIPSGWELENEYATKSADPRHPQAEYAKEWSASENVPFVDFYDQFEASNTATLNELYLDDTKGFHLNERGTQMVANELYSIISKQQLLPQ